MDRKITITFGVILGVLFATAFLLLWGLSSTIIRSTVVNYGRLYGSEFAFDLSMLNNTTVTASTLVNYEKHRESNAIYMPILMEKSSLSDDDTSNDRLASVAFGSDFGGESQKYFCTIEETHNGTCIAIERVV